VFEGDATGRAVFYPASTLDVRAKVAVDAQTQQILGAAILGVHGDEVIHALLEVMVAQQPYTLLARGVHIHPTVSELLPTLLEGLKPMV